ncbi:MAG TPA: hypothetical protein VFK65_16010, partial [Candidatus Binatia bacterium]|nr:hypothetical protein [Candidatus Binatia bacterium]
MKIKRFLPSALLLVYLASAASQINAQTRPEYIPLGGGVKGVLYRPDGNPTLASASSSSTARQT